MHTVLGTLVPSNTQEKSTSQVFIFGTQWSFHTVPDHFKCYSDVLYKVHWTFMKTKPDTDPQRYAIVLNFLKHNCLP